MHSGQRYLAGEHRGKALVRVAQVRVRRLRALIRGTLFAVGDRSRRVVMTVMAEMIGRCRTRCATIVAGTMLDHVANVRRGRVDSVDGQEERQEKGEQEAHHGGDSSSLAPSVLWQYA